MMLLKRPSRTWIFLLAGLVVVRLFILSPDLIEKFYSLGFYPLLGRFMRYLTGWLPFSLGDILYGIFILLIFREIVRWVNWFWKKEKPDFIQDSMSSYAMVFLFIYLAFNILWGLNYNRKNIGNQFGLEVESVDTTLLLPLTEKLRDKTNQCRSNYTDLNNYSEVAISGYHELSKAIPFLQPAPVSIKSSLLGSIGNYIGYSGYFNPFTGEAHVNTTIPKFMLPFVAGHEIGHQLGYAKEHEASFLGHLAAKASGNLSMQYSSYLNMFLAAHHELKRVDSLAAKAIWKGLDAKVLQDIQLYRDYLDQYDTPFGLWVDQFYNQYLKLNEQPSGMRSYNLVTVWLIAWFKKYGEI